MPALAGNSQPFRPKGPRYDPAQGKPVASWLLATGAALGWIVSHPVGVNGKDGDYGRRLRRALAWAG